MVGKTVLITGGTSGIGAAAAQALYRLGASMIIVGRNEARCERTVRDIRRTKANGSIGYVLGDLTYQDQIRKVAQEVDARCDKLDVLILNAGAYFKERELTVDGIEMTFALNHLAHFLLTMALLERVKQSSAGRIIIVSSQAHEKVTMDFENLQGRLHYDRLAAYAQSKLANLLFAYELDRRMKGTSVTVNALCPGATATNLGANNGWFRVKARNLWRLSRGQMVTAKEAAKSIVFLASSDAARAISGGYFRHGRQVASSHSSYDRQAALRLWDLSEQLGDQLNQRNRKTLPLA